MPTTTTGRGRWSPPRPIPPPPRPLGPSSSIPSRLASLVSLGGGLWEVRSYLDNGRTARVLFCIVEDRLVLPHGFIKKSQKTPPPDLSLARKWKKEIEQ